MFFQMVSTKAVQARDGTQTKREGSKHMSSPVIKHQLLSHFSLSCTLRNAHQSRGTERKEPSFFLRATAERCIVVVCRLGKIVVQRLVGQEDQRKKQGVRPDRSKRLLGTLGLRLLWWGEEEKERFGCSRDVNGARQRRE